MEKPHLVEERQRFPAGALLGGLAGLALLFAPVSASAQQLDLANHDLGQAGDRFTTSSPVTDVLFQFKLTRTGTFNVVDLRVRFTTGNGVASGDVTGAELWEDVNGNGAVDGADALVQGGVSGSGGVLPFTTDFTPGTSGTNYLVRASVSNLVPGDFTTFSLAAADVDESVATAEAGAIANALHFQNASSCSPAFNYFDSPIDVTPSVSNSWQDVNVSALVPTGATGVILQWRSTAAADHSFGIRKKGSSDPFFPNAAKSQQQHWVMTGLDSNRTFQVYDGSVAEVKVWLVGYTMSGVTFLTNRVDKSLGAAGAWVDVDISADTGADTAIGAIFLVNTALGTSRMFGLRKNGSTDNRVTDLRADTITVGIIGVDASEIAEMNVEDLSVDLYLVGYVTSGAVFFTNAVDKSTATTGAYVDVDITPNIGGDDANGAIVEITPSDNTRRLVALRPNGATYDLYEDVAHGFAAVGVDASNLFEQKIELATMDLYLVGYTLGSCGASTATTIYRSIGTAGNYVAGTVSATNGSPIVVGTGTSWKGANRGRGDRIGIGGTDFTILSVDTETQLTLTAPFTGTTGVGKAYTISRQFSTFQAWENCISGAGGCTFFPVANGNLVTGNRSEVGVAYKDTVFTPAAQVLIAGSTTDATHTITLTADGSNRHYGVAGAGVVVDGTNGPRGFRVEDSNVTVEWLELVRVRGVNDIASILIRGGTGSQTGVLLQNLLIHDFDDPGFNIKGIGIQGNGGKVATIRNTMFWDGDSMAIEGDELNDTLTVENCTVDGMVTYGIDAFHSTFIVRNTIVTSSGASFVVSPGDGSMSGSHNTSSDGTAATFFTFAQTSVSAASLYVAPNSDLHLRAGAVAINSGLDLSPGFSYDIDGSARPNGPSWDRGADEFGATTEVALVSFEAAGADAAVELSWETSSELRNLGFHLHRATTASGPYERITVTPIPGLGSSPHGARYRYLDAGLQNDVTYYYRLEDVESTGRTKLHGPVAAVPRRGAPSIDGELRGGLDENGASRVTYGDPEASSLRVVRRGPAGVTLELETEGFHAVPQEDGSVRLEIPGFESSTEPGKPSLPFKRGWIDAVRGRKVELVSVRASGLEAFSSLVPAPAEKPELVASRDGTIRVRRRRTAHEAFRGKELYPAEAARVVSVGFQGDAKKALLELSPLRWDGERGHVLLARRLVVTLSFRDRDPSESGTEESPRTRRRAMENEAAGRAFARLQTTERGLYVVRFEELFGRRGRAIATASLRLSRRGDAVPYHVEPRDDRFEPGSTLFFWSEGGGANPYGNEAVYELELARGGRTMERFDASPSGQARRHYWETLRREENRYYQAGLLDAPDLWLWELLFAPASQSFPFDVSALAPLGEPAQLSLWLQGASDDFASPDHHVRLYVNGTLVSERSWDGKDSQRIVQDLEPGLLREGGNALEIENVGDTEAAYSMVMVDRFEVRYPRLAVAALGRLEGVWSGTGVAEIRGLEPGALLLDTTGRDPLWLGGARVDGDGVVRARVRSGRRYLAVSPGALLHPRVLPVRATGLRSERRGADYVIVGPEELLSAAGPLLELRRSEGLRVAAVSMEDVGSEFGFGEITPEALKDFLSYCFRMWSRPSPRYVVLLGDATYDFKNYLGTGVRNHVPPRMIQTSYLWTASDPWYAAVHGDDALPDFAIGRLPASNAAEARAMVQKTVRYETEGRGLTKAPVVLVADDADEAGDFEARSDELASTTLAGRDVRKVYLSALGPTAARGAIVGAFDEGASLVSYAGHGGIQLWASENVLDVGDVASLAPQAQQPLLVTINCLNGYFHFPYFDSLAEELVKADGKGAIAAFSPSGLSLDAPAHLYQRALLRELVSGGHRRLGDAVLAAQERYAETGSLPELLSIYHLFGDPALGLR